MTVKGYDSASSEVRAALAEATAKTGMSADLLQAVAGRESTFNPMAKSKTSSASGMGQFLDHTWDDVTTRFGGQYGITKDTSRFDPRASALMMGELLKDNTRALRSSLGRDPTEGEAYASYFMGATGFSKIAQANSADPHANAWTYFPEEARANPTIFNGKSVGEVYANLTSTGGMHSADPLGKGASTLPNIFETTAEPPHRTFVDDWKAAYGEAAGQEQIQTMAAHMIVNAGDASLAPDPNFKWTPESIKAHTEDLPENLAQWVVDNAHSEGHANYLADKAKHDIASNQDLSEYGFLGNMGFRAAAIMTDLPSWMIGVGAGKVAMLGRAGLAARAVSAGLVEVAAQAPVEAMKASYHPGYGLKDALVDSASAFAMGATFGGAFGHAGDHLDERILGEAASINRGTLESEGHTLTPAGHAHYDVMEAQGMAPGSLPPKGNPQGMTSGGAAAVDPKASPSFLDRMGVSVASRLQRSHQMVAETGAMLDNEMSGNGGATLRGQETAFEEMRRTHEAADAGVTRVVESEFSAFAKERGLTGIQKAGAARDAFEEATGRQIYDPSLSADPHIAKSATAYAKGFGDWLDRAKASGATWAEDVGHNTHYFPMIFDREKVRSYVDRFGEEGVASVIKQALQKGQKQLTDEVAQRVAEKYLRVVRTSTEGMEGVNATALSGLDKEGLIELLTHEGLDPEDARAFVDAAKPDAKSGPRNMRAKTVMEDATAFTPGGSVRERVQGQGGTVATSSRAAHSGDAFSVRDLTKQNAEEVWGVYNRAMAGHTAMARQGFQTRGAFESHIKGITLGEANMRPGYTDSLAKRDYGDLSYLGKSIYGIPVRDLTTTGAKIESIFGNLNFMRFMGQSGIAQLGDMPKIMLKTGMAAAWQTFRIADVANVLRRGGAEASQLSRDLEVITGVGTQTARAKIVQKFRDIDAFYPDSKSATFLDRANRMTKTGSNVTALISGMTPVNDFLQRWAMRASMQHLADTVSGKVPKYARPGNALQASGQQLLNDMGLGPDELGRFKSLVDQMELSPEGVVNDLRMSDLRASDPEGVDKLGAYLSRQAGTIIVETSPGNLPRWMGDSAFRFMGQFRAFSFASHAANTLHNLKMGPAYAAQSLAVTGAWAGLVYTAHTYSKSIGRDDQQEYLTKNLDPLHVAASAFNRSSDSGILPQVIDTAMFPIYKATGWQSPFSNARTTGLSAGIQGTPLISLASDLTDVIGQGAAAIGGQKDFSKQDAQRMARLLPLNNTYVISNALRAITQKFPDEYAH
jgi:hypothetical protein